jgi:hypothetical protein
MADINALGNALPQGWSYDARTGGRTNRTWQEALRIGNSIVGELRSEADIQNLPRNVQLRAVQMPDGAIRWGTAHMGRVLRNAFHDCFLCLQDPSNPVRQGYITVQSDGRIVVQGATVNQWRQIQYYHAATF